MHLPTSPAARFELLWDLYAPLVHVGDDEYGEPILVRRPGEGFITREQLLELLEDA